MMKLRSKKIQIGFSLLEMAIVLVILGFVLGALLLPLRAQREQAAQLQSINTLENAKQALLGYAQQQGKLPCPATVASSGVEDQTPAGSGICTQQVGFLPAATLGLQPAVNGFAIDAWNNRIRYAVTQATVNDIAQTSVSDNSFTTSDGMSNLGIISLKPSLRVCATVSTSTLTCSLPVSAASPEKNYLINNAVVVIYSTGATGSLVVGGADENENLNPSLVSLPNQIDTVFVSHDITAAPNEFDHLVTWISPYVLYNAMIQAGQLH